MEKFDLLETSISHKLTYNKFKAVLKNNPIKIFMDPDKSMLKFTQKHKGLRIGQMIMKKEVEGS